METAKDLERTDELLEELLVRWSSGNVQHMCIVHDVVDIYIYTYNMYIIMI